ncbi:Pentatricopeptide repeat-containing protein [Actinidia chinensis var. chinensis]|uniref:Pentatricopeptide repeat-containing protein n=1 Tax=Actinidia chinensis var. chinensis TaxID=1590841 RepID=A0A2R6PAI2_ACTCC|nr:Pentatricopeptide repeat-containing protein [Actinidia chinensis var. chinensis]
MYISRFVHTKRLFNSLTLLTRSLASKSHTNKVSLYLQRAKLIDSIRLALRSNASRSLVPILNDPALDSFVVTNALRCAPSPDSALSLAETLKTIPHFTHTQHTLYALAKVLAKSQQTAKLKALVNAINSGKFPNVACVSFMDSMRWYATAGDLDLVLSVWNEWRNLEKHCRAESYNIVMSLYVQMGMNTEAVKTFYMMIDERVVPNARTYTVMIEHLVNSGKLDSARQIFGVLPLMRIKRTLRQYSILVGAFTGAEKFDVAKILLKEMQIDGLLPGHSMLRSLQLMQVGGFLEATDKVITEMIPDERIKNVGVFMDDDDDNDLDDGGGGDDDDDGNEDDSANGYVNVNAVRLKPWLDPAALANALRYWGPEEVSSLEDAKFVWTTQLVCKMIRSFRSAETAWQFFCWVSCQPGFTHDVYTVSRMIDKLARHHGHADLVDQLISKIKREHIKLPFSTIRLIIDLFGVFRNGHAALKVFRDIEILCGPISKSSLLLLYSSLLRTLAKCKMNSDVLDILDEMIVGGTLPDIQTFSGLMHHFALEGDIKVVQRLFGMVKQSGVGPDLYMFKVLIRAFCKCDRAVLALRFFKDMTNSNLMPDAAIKQLLVKSLWKEGKFREAAAVEEKSEEINNALPLALRDHLYTVSSEDLARVCKIYSDSFKMTNC